MMLNLMVSLGLMNLLAAMAPGPDFAIVLQQTLNHGRKSGLWTAAGISTALLIHMSYCALGLALILTHTPWAVACIKILGGSYLIYLGITTLKSNTQNKEKKKSNQDITSAINDFRKGFLINALNPKAMLFTLTIWTIISTHQLSWPQQALIALTLSLIVFSWFCILAMMITQPKIYQRFISHQNHITKVMAAMFIIFGLALIVSIYPSIPQHA